LSLAAEFFGLSKESFLRSIHHLALITGLGLEYHRAVAA
jgi:hypothetical protein